MGPEASLAFSLQALFERHEAYAADTEAERVKLQAEISRLEDLNVELEKKNVALTQENDDLRKRHSGSQSTSHNEYDSTTNSRHLEAHVEQLEAKQTQLQTALNRALDQERVVVKDWLDTKQEVQGLRTYIAKLEKDMTVRDSTVPISTTLKVPYERDSTRSVSTASTASNSSMSTQEDTMQLAMARQEDVLLLLKHQVDDLRSQLLTQKNLDFIQNQPSSTQEVTLDLSNKSQEVHVHHHYHADSTRPQTLHRAKTQAVRSKKPLKLNLNRARSTRISSRETFNDPMLEQASAIQLALAPRRSESRSSSATPRPFRTISSFSAVSSSPHSVQSTVFEQVDSDAECSRPTTPGSSGLWTPVIEKDDDDNRTVFHQDVGDYSASLPYDVPAPDYFSSSPIASPSKSHNKQEAHPVVEEIPVTPEQPAQDADPSTPKPLQIPRSRPLRSTASLALLRPDTASSTNSSNRPATRRLQSLPSSKAAASVVTHLDTLPAVTITHATASPARASIATRKTSTSAATTCPESNETAKESFGGLRVGSWLQKWRGSKPKTETDATCKTGGVQHINKNDRSVSAPVAPGVPRKVSSTVAKLQAILDTDEARHDETKDVVHGADAAVPDTASQISTSQVRNDTDHDASAKQPSPNPHSSQSNQSKPRTDPSMLRDLSTLTTTTVSTSSSRPVTAKAALSPPLVPAKRQTPMRTPGVNQPGGLGLFLRSVSDHSFFPGVEEARVMISGAVDEDALRDCFDEDDWGSSGNGDEDGEGEVRKAEDENDGSATPRRGSGDATHHSALTFFPRPRLDDDGISTFAPATPRVGRVAV